MRTMFQHHDDIPQPIENAEDDAKDAWASIFVLTHAYLKPEEFVKETRIISTGFSIKKIAYTYHVFLRTSTST